MANQITLGATLLFDGGDGTGGAPDDLTGAATGTLDTSTFLQGSNSYTYSASNTRSGMLYDAGSAQNWANSVFYITVNSGVVGLLDTLANGGFRIRFCGATVTDFFEVNVGGSNSWPISIQGGWVTFVVDIEAAKSDAGRITGGTEPATNAIRYVGFSQLLTVMPKMADNTWFDTVYRLPQNTAAIIIEGRNGGTTDWNDADILTQLGTGQMFYFEGPGGSYVIQGPIQFGINDTTTHGFTATNLAWLFNSQAYVVDGFYGLSALGNSGGTTNVTLGVKTGTGAAATGAQGAVIQAASDGPRWAMDFDDPNLDAIGFYGCSFQHGGTFQLDDAAVDIASVNMIDVSKAHLSNANVVRLNVVAPNTADGVAFCDTDDIGDIINSTFEFSDGHAIEILSGGPASQSNVGNTFLGAYGGTPGDNNTPSSGSTDAMIYNNSAAAKTFNRSGGGTQPSFRNGASATSDDVASINLTFTPLIAGSDISVFATGSNTPITASDSSGTSFVASVDAGQAIDYKIYRKGYLPIEVYNVSFSASQNVLVQQRFDKDYDEVDVPT